MKAIRWFIRNICVFSFLLLLFVSWVGLHGLLNEQNHRITENQHHIDSIARVCVAFAAAHNGLINDDIATLKVALNEHGMFPDAARQIQERIDAYNSHRVDPANCLPEKSR